MQRYANIQPILANIYIGTEENILNDTLINVTLSGANVAYNLTHAKGIAAYGYNIGNEPLNNGDIDLKTRLDSLSAGEYAIESNLTIPSIPAFRQTFKNIFNIAFNNDLEVNRIISPKTNDYELYPFSIPVSAVVRNFGKNAVTVSEQLQEYTEIICLFIQVLKIGHQIHHLYQIWQRVLKLQ